MCRTPSIVLVSTQWNQMGFESMKMTSLGVNGLFVQPHAWNIPIPWSILSVGKTCWADTGRFWCHGAFFLVGEDSWLANIHCNVSCKYDKESKTESASWDVDWIGISVPLHLAEAKTPYKSNSWDKGLILVYSSRVESTVVAGTLRRQPITSVHSQAAESDDVSFSISISIFLQSDIQAQRTVPSTFRVGLCDSINLI